MDANALPITLKLAEGQAQDRRSAKDMLDTADREQTLLADRTYDSDTLRQTLTDHSP